VACERLQSKIIWTGDGLASWAAKHQNKEKKAKKKGGNPRISYLCRDHSTKKRTDPNSISP